MKKFQIEHINKRLAEITKKLRQTIKNEGYSYQCRTIINGIYFNMNDIFELIRSGKVSIKSKKELQNLSNYEQGKVEYVYDYSKYVKIQKKYDAEIKNIQKFVDDEEAKAIDNIILKDATFQSEDLEQWKNAITKTVEDKLKKVLKQKPTY